MVVRIFAPRPEQAVARSVARQAGKRALPMSCHAGPASFMQLPTRENFVRVVGGFGGGEGGASPAAYPVGGFAAATLFSDGGAASQLPACPGPAVPPYPVGGGGGVPRRHTE